ncbi:hypothetical protein BC827DRAFT_927016 [Russula dissimulans]|nr:hypothetical protein BC827DRAFT_927016 [Russula dissimulans]
MSQEYIDIGPHGAEDAWINSVITITAAVILYYDYILTLHREIRFLWPPHNKQGWFTIACLLNRYIPVLGYLPLVVSYFIKLDFPVRPCTNLHVYHQWFVMTLQTHVGVLCLIRVYALYGRSRRVLGFLASIGIMAFFTAAGIVLARRHARSKPITVLSSFVPGCSHFTPSIEGRFSAIEWSGVSVFDSAVFSLTVYKAFTMGRGIPLLDVIVRDGTMYFLVLFIMNLANIFILLYSAPLLRSSTAILVNVLSITLVSRLVLNLREQDSIPAYLLTTIETEQRFQAGLPDGERSMTWIKSHPSVRTNNLTYEMEAVGSVAAGVSLISVKMIAEMGSEEALVGVTSMLDIGPK